ncbi:cryptochrome/photolyase family protein [Undibacterium sp. Ji22W]|uniref:cryptochrome/photolyase family protein n=1 Tax=Undibacterium sp. Ji22W TaxID=3413038 RepID=UPI003BF39F34
MIYTKSLVWFRRDLRHFDNAALYHALKQSNSCYCVFIFDKVILRGLPKRDRRVQFIHQSIQELRTELKELGTHLIVLYGDPVEEIPRLAAELEINAVFVNRDYEPAALQRDQSVQQHLGSFNCDFIDCKDQVIFDKDEVLSLAGKPFSVFTPYKNAWLKKLASEIEGGADFYFKPYPVRKYAGHFAPHTKTPLPSLASMGFEELSEQELKLQGGMNAGAALLEEFLNRIDQYGNARDFPAIKGPSYLSVHLRFGTVSIRYLVSQAMRHIRIASSLDGASVWLSELIWRDFYFMILHHNPRVVGQAYKPEYDAIHWESGSAANELFKAWCDGKTGYPLVDAAMQQLNQTGYMHNRLRMVVASFLVKDLGIDWRWGEAYFALNLNDFDLSANNGGWQWAASTGCDAQPYFRIFNPTTQSEKFDSDGKFIRRYLPQLAKLNAKQIHAPWKLGPIELTAASLQLGVDYPYPIVAHDVARLKTLERYSVVKKVG